jgi:hypothetical protein
LKKAFSHHREALALELPESAWSFPAMIQSHYQFQTLYQQIKDLSAFYPFLIPPY